MRNQNNNDAWTTFWCGLILLAAIWSVYDWYGDHYCEGTAIPVLCSKEQLYNYNDGRIELNILCDSLSKRLCY